MSSFGDNNGPNLLGGSVPFDKIRKSSRDDESEEKPDPIEEIMKNLNKYKTTDTDLEFHLIANPKKLVDDDQIKYYDGKKKHDTETSRHHDVKYDDKKESEKRDDRRDNDKRDDRSESNRKDDRRESERRDDSDDRKYTEQSKSVPNDKYEGFASEEELNLAKLAMLRKLVDLKTKGARLSQNYSMSSSYKLMKYEHDLHMDIRNKHVGIKWLNNFLCNICWGFEIANDYFNPFDFHLKGWSEQISEEPDEYCDVLDELYEKYFKSGHPIPPELKLIFMIGSSAASYHARHAMLNIMPNLKDSLNQNPDLKKRLDEQTAQRVKALDEKRKAAYDKKMQQDQEALKVKMDELHNLKNMEMENSKQDMLQRQIFQQQEMEKLKMQNEIASKTRQLEKLRMQLDQQRSDSKSMFTEPKSVKQQTMKMPPIPTNVNKRLTKKTQSQDDYNNAVNMSMGVGAVVVPSKVCDDIDDIITKELESNYSKDSDISKPKSKGKRRVIKVKT